MDVCDQTRPCHGCSHSCRFILVMVLYNLFSVPYIVSFVASENCGEANVIKEFLLPLSSVCLRGSCTCNSSAAAALAGSVTV